MSKNKTYAAVFQEGNHKYYDNWEACRIEVTGKSSVKFKGFKSKDDAHQWVENLSRNTMHELETDGIAIYIDGSFTPKCKKAGWAWVAVKSGVMLKEEYGVTSNDALSRNIDGELEASIMAIQWAVKHKQEVVIRYDYSGIEMWATGSWKVKSVIAQAYVREITPLSSLVRFDKVKGHSGNKWNDRADELAKKGIQEYLQKFKKKK